MPIAQVSTAHVATAPATQVTHQQIASKLGISRTVVTEALHRSPNARIKPETRERVWQVAREMGYQPRNLTTHSVGYVLPVEELAMIGETALMLRIEVALRERSYRLSLTGLDEEHPASLQEVFHPKSVDGVLFARWYGGQVATALSPQVPYLLISHEANVGKEVDMLALDARGTARAAVEYLLKLGHRRICLQTGDYDVLLHRELIAGAEQTLQAAGLPKDNLLHVRALILDDALGQLMELLRREKPPTAIISLHAECAMLMLYAMRSCGYRVPEDVSLISLTDAHSLQSLRPRPTTTSALGDEFAKRVVQRLIERIRRPDLSPEHVLLPGKIREGETCGPAPRKVRLVK